ncbi:hypothetical protein WS80_24945 [Burkholderia pseudomultivorans]|nr:hypothetical protein WS80_24945 [Burkholderia pseudomultivorans]
MCDAGHSVVASECDHEVGPQRVEHSGRVVERGRISRFGRAPLCNCLSIVLDADQFDIGHACQVT